MGEEDAKRVAVRGKRSRLPTRCATLQQAIVHHASSLVIAATFQYGETLKEVRPSKFTHEEVWEFWRKWRDQNLKIVKFWDKLEQTTVEAVANPRRNVAYSDG
jgi:hypothetical protein